MRRLFLTTALVLGLLCPPLAQADLYVIVNRNNPVQTLTAEQVSSLFLGRARGVDANGALTNSSRMTIYEHPDTSTTRAAFFEALNGMQLNNVISYWARLRFSGQILPPEVLPDSPTVLARVKNNPEAIGYVDAALADASVKVVLRLKR